MSQPYSQQPQQQQHNLQYSIPPAPTFASLGGTVMPYASTLGSLAQNHHVQAVPGSQGLSAAIPPSAYLMQQTQQFLQQHHQQQQQHQHHLLQQQQQQQPAAEKKSARREDTNSGLILPLHKVKRLIKSESSVKAVSGEASFGIARATELLLEQLLERAYQRMAAGKRESIEYSDVAGAISRWPAAEFLRDTVPETQTLQELIERVKRQDNALSQTKPAITQIPKPQAPETAAGRESDAAKT